MPTDKTLDIRQTLRGAARSVTVWVNGLFLTAVPYADQIITAVMTGVSDYLPELQPYLPANWYRAVGIVVVAFNIVQRARTTKSLAEKAAK